MRVSTRPLSRNLALLLAGLAALAAPPPSARAGNLSSTPAWESPTGDDATALAWGDYDSDGRLDLVIATSAGQPFRLYHNDGGTLSLAWSSAELDDSSSVAWADVNRDGDLDLAVGNHGAPNRLYRNDAGTLVLDWSAAEIDDTTDVAWADWNGDGDLDLAVGNRGGPLRLYDNVGGALTLAWWSVDLEPTTALAWGRLDGDGLPELAVGNDGAPTRVYRATGTELVLAWSAPVAHATRALAWNDLDEDGDLDLLVANDREPWQSYDNSGGVLALAAESTGAPAARCIAALPQGGDVRGNYVVGPEDDAPVPGNQWPASETGITRDCAWGDLDGDGDLDLAIANGQGAPSRVYPDVWLLQNGGWDAYTGLGIFAGGRSVALADYDCDGDLDVAAVGDYSPIGGGPGPVAHVVFENLGGQVPFRVGWSSPDRHVSLSAAWGDFDADGDVDLAVASVNAANRVYRNEGDGSLTLAWSATEIGVSTSLAWGDRDGDGDLDLVVADASGPVRLYDNDGAGGLALAWSSPVPHVANGAAWVDLDLDGDLDLALATGSGPQLVYRNDLGTLSPGWASPETEHGGAVAAGDADGDGLPDLAIAGALGVRIYHNDGGGLLSLAWRPAFSEGATAVAWADFDGDGDLDLGVTTGLGYRVLGNPGDGRLVEVLGRPDIGIMWGLAWGDLDDDGDLELMACWRDGHAANVHRFVDDGPRPSAGLPDTAGYPVLGVRPGATQAAGFHSSAERLGSPVLVPYQLFDREGDTVGRITAEYSTVGGGAWRPATPAPGGDGLRDLATSAAGEPHVFAWDAAADGVETDQALFRIAIPVQVPRRIGFPLVHGQRSAVSAPFRVAAPGAPPAPLALVALMRSEATGPVYPGAVIRFRIELRNLGAVDIAGVEVADIVDDFNLNDAGSPSSLDCPAPGVGAIDRTGTSPVVRCSGLVVPAGGSVEVAFDARVRIPYRKTRGFNGTPIQRVCNAAGASFAGGCSATPPVCVGIDLSDSLPRFTKAADGWDDQDGDGRVDAGEGLWFRLELCAASDGAAPSYDFDVEDLLGAGTSGTFDRLTATRGVPGGSGAQVLVSDIVLFPGPDPATACATVRFRTRAGNVPAGSAVCNVARARWTDPLSGAPAELLSNGDDPLAPSACFTVEDTACLSPSLAPLADLMAVKEAGAVRLSWRDDPAAPGYHVNSVRRKTDLAASGPQRPLAGVGLGQCEAPAGTPTCTDADAFTDGETLLFYRVMSACGPTGFEEGPP